MTDQPRHARSADSDQITQFRAARAKVNRAREDLVEAARRLRLAGLPENADSLMVEARRLQVWTQQHGWLDMIDPERKPAPSARRKETTK